MAGIERNLHTPHDDIDFGRIEAGYDGGQSMVVAMTEADGAAHENRTTGERNAEAALHAGHAAIAYANTGKPYMNGFDYRRVVL